MRGKVDDPKAFCGALMRKTEAKCRRRRARNASPAYGLLADPIPSQQHSMTMADVSGVEIFATGKWKGQQWTEADLDQMVRNFGKLRDHIKPPLKLGHDDNQVLAQKDGQPALGWITRLRRTGRKLVADIADVPKAVVELLRQGRYRRVSSEIYTDFEDTTVAESLGSKVKGKVLAAVALLGADFPEVKVLEDLPRVLALEGVTFAESPPAEGAVACEANIGPTTTARDRFARADTFAKGSIFGFQRAVDVELAKRYPFVPERDLYGARIRDLFDDEVIVEVGDELLRHSIEEDGGEITLGEPEKVRPTFVTATDDDDDDPLVVRLKRPPFISTGTATSRSEGRQTMSEPTKEQLEQQEREKAAERKKLVEEVTAEVKTAVAEEMKAKDETIKRLSGDVHRVTQARQHEAAERFADGLMQAKNPKITQAMRPYVIAMYERLGNDAVMLAADQATELKLFAEGETPRDIGAHECLTRLIDAMPDLGGLLKERTVATDSATGGDASDTWDGIVRMVAKEKALDPETQYVQAATIAMRDPRYKERAPKYGKNGT
jgi:hypothetical protein